MDPLDLCHSFVSNHASFCQAPWRDLEPSSFLTLSMAADGASYQTLTPGTIFRTCKLSLLSQNMVANLPSLQNNHLLQLSESRIFFVDHYCSCCSLKQFLCHTASPFSKLLIHSQKDYLDCSFQVMWSLSNMSLRGLGMDYSRKSPALIMTEMEYLALHTKVGAPWILSWLL